MNGAISGGRGMLLTAAVGWCGYMSGVADAVADTLYRVLFIGAIGLIGLLIMIGGLIYNAGQKKGEKK